MAIANLISDNDVKNLVHIKSVIKDLVRYTATCANLLTNETSNIERCPMTFESSSEETCQVVITQVNGVYFYLVDFLNVLYHFSVSDEIKYEIYEQCGMREYLRMIVYHGNQIEKQFALRLLWQLCFDQRVGKHVQEDSKLMNYIEKLFMDSLR
jgi:hypothetical protein